MTRTRLFTLCAALALAIPSSICAQELLSLQSGQINRFASRVRGSRGAWESIVSARTPKLVREAIADTLTAILNAPPTDSLLISQPDALAALLGVASSIKADVSEIGWNRLTMLAMSGRSHLTRLNAATLIAMHENRTRGASVLKRIATSKNSVAVNALDMLTGMGETGNAALRQIFLEDSAVDDNARKFLSRLATRKKWVR